MARTPQDLRQRVDSRERTMFAGDVTLTANAATTVVSVLAMAASAHVFFSPRTANAAAEIGAGTMYVSARSKWSFTITHANNAQTDRTFSYQIVAGDL
jgi:hypothetical protein